MNPVKVKNTTVDEMISRIIKKLDNYEDKSINIYPLFDKYEESK